METPNSLDETEHRTTSSIDNVLELSILIQAMNMRFRQIVWPIGRLLALAWVVSLPIITSFSKYAFVRIIQIAKGWMTSLIHDIKSPEGYKIISVIIAIYIFFYQERVQSYERDIQGADEVYNNFMMFAAQSNSESLSIAMRFWFLRVQLREVMKEPLFLSWLGEITSKTLPYKDDLRDWLQIKLDTSHSIGRQVDLSKADLKGAFLDRIRFFRTNLREANLQGAQLGSVRIEASNLTRADLRFSDLSGAQIVDSILDCGDLSGSHAPYGRGSEPFTVKFSNLRGANLDHVKFEHAVILNDFLSYMSCGNDNTKKAHL